MRPILRTVVATLLFGMAVTTTPKHADAQLIDTKALSAGAVQTILSTAEATAKKNGWKVSIAVVDQNGDLLGFIRLDGASLGTVQISQGKARTAARFARPTKVYADRIANDTLNFLSVDGVYALQGGLPILHNGMVIGAVGVSGVTSAQDEQIAESGIAAIKK